MTENRQTAVQLMPIGAALLGLALVALAALLVAGARQAGAAAVGFAGGLALYHAAFGFTGGWRRFIVEGRGRSLRAQLLLLALVVPVSYPLIAAGGAGAWVVPAGLGMVVGAFLFGIGMQLGGGCGSGTLFTVGGGSVRMLVVLFFFVVGSVIGTAHVGFWYRLPGLPPVSLLRLAGPGPAVALTLALCAALAALTLAVERRRNFAPEPPKPTGRWLTGPWSPWAGAVALAIVCIATLLVVGRPWGITSAFALWGAKGAAALGVPVETWPYWSGGRAGALGASVFRDTTSVMNFGVMLGAMAAAGLAGRYRPRPAINRTELATAVAGGLLMGYGARLASGCNIGGFIGGVTSGSLHGWVWLVAAFAGSSLTVWLMMPRRAAAATGKLHAR